MGVFKKLKDVLFDIEDEELPIITKKEAKKEPVKESNKYKEENTIKEIKIPREEISERELMSTEPSFNFPLDFDEEPVFKRSKDIETFRKQDTKDYSNLFNDEPIHNRSSDYFRSRDLMGESYNSKPKAAKPSGPFKPTPIISPVYGVLDQNYSKDDIIVKTDMGVKGPDLDAVRKKAYGIEDKKSPAKKIEETKENTKDYDDSLKTLDEILMEEENKRDLTKKIPKIKVEDDELPDEPFSDEKTLNVDDTVESDLFNLIDSMYEDKEEREEE